MAARHVQRAQARACMHSYIMWPLVWQGVCMAVMLMLPRLHESPSLTPCVNAGIGSVSKPAAEPYLLATATREHRAGMWYHHQCLYSTR